MGLVIKWDITYKCNLMCDHCINGNYLNQNEDELTLSEVKAIIDKIHSHIPIEHIQFLGGEPLTRTDFIDILSYLNSKGIRFGFNTNGLLITSKQINQLGTFSNFDSVILSVEGPNAEVNDAIRGKSVFNILINRIRLLNNYKKQNPDSNFKIFVNTVLTSKNYEYVADMIELCKKENINELNLLEFIEGGNGVGKSLSLNNEQFLQVIKTVAQKYSDGLGNLVVVPKFARPMAKKYVKECLNLEFPTISHTCGAGSSFLYLDNRGTMYPCDRERECGCNGTKILDEVFWNIWDSEDYTKPFTRYYGSNTYKNLFPCNECEYLGEECFPCHLLVDETKDSQMGQCVLYGKLIQQRREDCK